MWISRAWNQAFHVPLAVVVYLFALLGYFVSALPGGVDLSDGPGTFLSLAALIWILSFTTRVVQPSSKPAIFFESMALLLALGVLAAFTSASMALGGKPFIDEQLVAIDAVLFPFLNLPALILALPDHPLIYQVLNFAYGSMFWQAVTFLLIASVWGKTKDAEFLLAGWALGLSLCITPFYWLPALSPYNYFGIQQSDMHGAMVGLPWEFLPIVMELRSGTVMALTEDHLTGMVTIPSFHACAATVLAFAWWRFHALRWPMLALNVCMALAAVPVGSHYGIDIVAGVGVGLLACALASKALRIKACHAYELRTSTRRWSVAKTASD